MIEVKKLCKTFSVGRFSKKRNTEHSMSDDPRQANQQFNALEGVSFRCNKGQVLALLGPNGAGKTTALRILASAIRADSGQILINDEDVSQDPKRAREQIGFLSGSTGLYERLSVKENVKYFARLHGVTDADFESRFSQLITRFAMQNYVHKRAGDLSTGMKQKASIVRSVIHQPSVIVLDEPTTGLDIVSRQAVIEFVLECKEQGTPVIISTHYLDEVSKLCDRVCVVNYGRTVFDDSLAAFSELGAGDLHAAFMNCIRATTSGSDSVLFETAPMAITSNSVQTEEK